MSRRLRAGSPRKLLCSLGALLSAIGLTGSLFVAGGGAAVQIPEGQLVQYSQVPTAQELLDDIAPSVDGATDEGGADVSELTTDEATGEESTAES